MRIVMRTISFFLASAGCATAAATADRELLDVLLANGTITQEQYNELACEELDREDLRRAEITLDRNGVMIRSNDGRFSMRIGGRLHADLARHRGDSATGFEATDGTELRRARIELGGTFHGDWGWAAESDFADDEISVKDFWLRYRGLDAAGLTIGHQKQPYSLAREMSANDIPFMERSIDNALVAPFVDRALGVRADAAGGHWFAAAGLFGEPAGAGAGGGEGWAVVGRYVYAPIVEPDRVLHLGFRGAYREPADASPSVRVRDETTHFSNLHVVDTGVLTGVDSVTLLGPEAAYVDGRFSLAGEYNAATLSRRALGNLDFSSWHVAVTWSLSGESRASAYRIDSGEFKRLTPARSFSRTGGRGAWELAVRYASLDLNDDDVVGGSEKTVTAGANWYVNSNVRMLFDWTRILDTDGSNAIRAGAEGMSVFAVRAQYAF